MEFLKGFFLLLLISFSTAAYALEIVPEIGVSTRNFEYTTNGMEYIENTFPALRYGITAVEGKFYAHLYGESSLQTGEKIAMSPQVIEDYATLKRHDAALSIGYKFNKNISFFGGYKWGKTNLDTEKEIDNTPNIPNDSYLIETLEHELKAHGPFVGISYSYLLGNNNSIGVNAAYSKLNSSLGGEAKHTQDYFEEPLGSDNLDLDSDGYSIGLYWSNKISKKLAITTNLDNQRYTYENKKSKLNLKENQTSFRFLVKYLF